MHFITSRSLSYFCHGLKIMLHWHEPEKKIAYSCKNLQENELFQNNELLTHGTAAEALQWCQPLVCQ